MDVRWSRRRDSNPEPAVYKTAALPIELRRRDGQGHTAVDPIRRRQMIGPTPGMGQARSGSGGGLLALRTARARVAGGSGRRSSSAGSLGGSAGTSAGLVLARVIARLGALAALVAAFVVAAFVVADLVVADLGLARVVALVAVALGLAA